MTFSSTIPVLQVSNVAKSMAWYGDVLGFTSRAFPEDEPHSFAVLNRDGVELMLQKCEALDGWARKGWSVYIRVTGNQLLDLADRMRTRTELTREPERMPYGDVEFAVADPDGHEIVLSEHLPQSVAVPSAAAREANSA